MTAEPFHKKDHLPDEEIIQRFCAEHDLELLGGLYKKYMALVYGVCMKYLKNREESQDAVMQIFETLIRDIPRFEIRNFKAWLYGVTKNHCLMRLRKLRKEKQQHVSEYAADFMESASFMHLQNETDHEAQMENLSSCMETLNASQRDCIELFYYKHKCYKEIATQLKLDEKQVKSYIQNGKRMLKICLEKKELIDNV